MGRLIHYENAIFHWILIAGLFLLYLLLPTHNSSVDGWGYACEIKYGEFLFRPHHLLYNITGWLILKFLSALSFTPDVLGTMKVVNAVAGAAALVIVWKILQRLGIRNTDLWILFTGTSFGVMRFATENETYLIPICLSLLAGYWILRYLKDQKEHSLLLAGVFAALACLYHQVQIFWWIGFLMILVSKRSFRILALYLLPGLVVPVLYALVLVFYEGQDLTTGNFLGFILHDYLEPGNGINAGIRNLVLTPASLFRTFFQVHGYIWYLIQLKMVYWIPGIVTLLLLVMAFSRNRFVRDPVDLNSYREVFRRSIICIFILQLVFAFISDGNAEFMVSFPFMVPIILAPRWNPGRSFLLPFAGALLIWNVSFGLLPAHLYNYYDYDGMITSIEKNRQAIYVIEERNITVNQYYYIKGIDISGMVFPYPPGKDLYKVCSLQSSGMMVITDVLSHKIPLNRKRILSSGNPSDDFILIDTIRDMNSLFGPYTLDRVVLNCNPEIRDNK